MIGAKPKIAALLAKKVRKKIEKWSKNAPREQEKVFQMLIGMGRSTAFGRDHQFHEINNYEDFKKRVPLSDYEGLKPYIDRMVAGEADVLWRGKPLYWAKTSGTTSGAKYIPISKHSMPNHINGARNALFSYIALSGNSDFLLGKLIFLQGSPVLEKIKGINTGRLSGIVAHHVPAYLKKNRLPSYETNCIEDWETKVDQIVEETSKEDMRMISGIPSWIQMYYEKLIQYNGKKSISEIFPNLSLFVYGGVNFEPYRAKFNQLVGKEIDTLETYPASEGFIAFQDERDDDGLLLIVNDGIFYEFIPLAEVHNENPTRLSIAEVKLNEQYAIVLNTNAGLWGYIIGDSVKFTSLNPYKIKVTGRIKHYTSAFGEHVISEEVEAGIKYLNESFNLAIREFHLAPQVNPNEGLPYHEWFIECEEDYNEEEAVNALDQFMQNKNIYYKDLIEGNILKPLVLRKLPSGAFNQAMLSRGKLGGQNKVPKLANDRSFASLLENTFV